MEVSREIAEVKIKQTQRKKRNGNNRERKGEKECVSMVVCEGMGAYECVRV